jgi:flagellar biosynthetic protein FliP
MSRVNMRSKAVFHALILALLAAAPAALGQEGEDLGEALAGVAQQAIQPGNVSTTLSLLFLITVLSLAPAILVMTTSFTRIIVVLGFLRQAMATQQTPPNQVLIGLALFLTFYIMTPTFEAVNADAIVPYRAGQISAEQAVQNALTPIRQFMFRQARAEDIALFLEIADLKRPNTPADVPTHVLINAFVLSELRTAFQIGFVLYIPFLIIDMVVASTLMSMGMMMLPPVFVSLPFKIIMFVLADGWRLIVESLVRSFQ